MPYKAIASLALDCSTTLAMSLVSGLLSGLLYVIGTVTPIQIDANTSVGVNLYALCSIIGGVILAVWVVGTFFHKIMFELKSLAKGLQEMRDWQKEEREKAEERTEKIAHIETQMEDLACRTSHGCPLPQWGKKR